MDVLPLGLWQAKNVKIHVSVNKAWGRGEEEGRRGGGKG